jgi:hypothetical protein
MHPQHPSRVLNPRLTGHLARSNSLSRPRRVYARTSLGGV